MTPDLLGKLMALLSAVLWAGAVIFFKLAGDSVRPLALNLYKTALTAAILLPFLVFTGAPLIPPALPNSQWLAIIASGILGIAVSDTLFFACLNRIGAGMSAIVDCLYAPFVMTAAWLFLYENPSPQQLGGGALVITAVLLAAFRRSGALPPKRIIGGILYGAASMALMAISVVLMRPALDHAPVFWVIELRLLAALAALAVLFALQKDRRQQLAPLWQKGSRFYAFWGSILGNLIAMTLWVAAFKYTSVNSAAVLNQTSTVFVVILATVFLKEIFTRRRLAATILAIAGSLLILPG
ncbi:MAG: DMT family transporter [Elusimicrobiota bacterium]|nr:DMT family transporter [Elusimicrobiota bacterium]